MSDNRISVKLAGPHIGRYYTIDAIKGSVTLTSDYIDTIRRGDKVTEYIATRLASRYDVTIVAVKGAK
jgi:hypothetical protein